MNSAYFYLIFLFSFIFFQSHTLTGNTIANTARLCGGELVNKTPTNGTLPTEGSPLANVRLMQLIEKELIKTFQADRVELLSKTAMNYVFKVYRTGHSATGVKVSRFELDTTAEARYPLEVQFFNLAKQNDADGAKHLLPIVRSFFVKVEESASKTLRLPAIEMEIMAGSVAEIREEFHLSEPGGDKKFWPQLLSLVRSVALGLRALHSAGISHRDVKLSNLLYERRGDGTVLVKLSDYGASLEAAKEDPEEPYQSKLLVGTPGYLSIEQIVDLQSTTSFQKLIQMQGRVVGRAGSQELFSQKWLLGDKKFDLFALRVLALELICGKLVQDFAFLPEFISDPNVLVYEFNFYDRFPILLEIPREIKIKIPTQYLPLFELTGPIQTTEAFLEYLDESIF